MTTIPEIIKLLLSKLPLEYPAMLRFRLSRNPDDHDNRTYYDKGERKIFTLSFQILDNRDMTDRQIRLQWLPFDNCNSVIFQD